jgi:transposase
MAHPQKESLRELSEQEEQELHRTARATSERVDRVRRAKVLLAVAAGKSWTLAAREAGLKSGDGVGKLVKRFNAHGLAALSIAAGAGRKPTYTSEQRAHIIAEVQRSPDRKEDQTATWSLMTLRQALRKKGLSSIAAETIRLVLHEEGYSYQRTRTWCRTGYALRKRKSGTVTVYDPETPEKKESLSKPTSMQRVQGSCNCVRMKLDRTKPSHNQERHGSRKAIPHYSHTSTNAVGPPNC